jgi:aminoglycoside phosphotransferase (APT) family kinase protein
VLERYDRALPTLVGPITDVTAALAISEDPVLHDAAADLLPVALTWPRRPLHGDAHTGNVLLTPEGPRWTDLEDVCVGPVEWDLASTTVTQDAVEAYPGPVDRARLADCRDLRRLQILAGVLTDDVQDPRLYDGLVEALRRRLA